MWGRPPALTDVRKSRHPRVVGPRLRFCVDFQEKASVLKGGKLGYWIEPIALRALIRLKSRTQLIQIRTAWATTPDAIALNRNEAECYANSPGS
jgi:hypothetical protein